MQGENTAGLTSARSHIKFIGNYLKKSEGTHNLKLSFNIQGVTQFQMTLQLQHWAPDNTQIVNTQI